MAGLSLFESFGKLLTETMRAIQRDVLKIVLLAAASLIYRSVKDALSQSTLNSSTLRGGPVFYLLAVLGAIAIMHASQQQSQEPSYELQEHVQTSRHQTADGTTISQSRIHPLAVVGALASVIVIDRSGMVSSLGHLLNQFADLVGPAFQRFFMLGQSTAAAPRVNRLAFAATWFRRIAPYAIIAQLVHALQQTRAAHALYAAKQLAEAQRWPIERWVRQLQERGNLWQGISAVVGTASAAKYLLRR